MSASLAPAAPPLAGIAFLPLIALAVRPSTPAAKRGAHPALSPSLGALATPVAWQTAQVCVYSAGTASALVEGVATVTTAAAVAGAAAGAGVAATGTTAAAATLAGAENFGSSNLPPPWLAI